MNQTKQFTRTKNNYEAPKTDTVSFLSADVITSSDENQGEWDPQ